MSYFCTAILLNSVIRRKQILEKVIEINNLYKKFKKIMAVDDLNVNVYRGDVFGFLGPNGAGKSTTIRMLMTLIFPTSGSVKVFGMPLHQNRLAILARTGGIVEKPDLYNYMSARKNLEMLGSISGREIPKKRIDEVLELVGLTDRQKSRVKTFSFGMKQRLGIAQALVHDPELIILDEPTTGLDPQGMKEIRELIFFLSRVKKKTIFLSSHILSEVELVADRMIIIDKGKTVVEGYVKELLKTPRVRVDLDTDEPQRASDLIKNSLWNSTFEGVKENIISLNMEKDAIPELNRFLIQNSINVFGLTPKRSLEEYFLNITEKGAK